MSGAHLLRSLGAVAQVAASNRSSADPTTCGCARSLARGPQKVQLLKRIHPYYKASLEHTVSIYVHLCPFMSIYVHLCPFMSIYVHYVCLFVWFCMIVFVFNFQMISVGCRPAAILRMPASFATCSGPISMRMWLAGHTQIKPSNWLMGLMC